MRTTIIKMLGGYTKAEYQESFNKGRKDAFRCVKDKADALFGQSADTWCEQLYKYVYEKVR